MITNPPSVPLTDEEAKRVFEAQCQHYLGISGAEFIKRLDAGEIEESDNMRWLTALREFAGE